MKGILPSKPEVLNGIAYNKVRDQVVITGKNWPWLFLIKICKVSTPTNCSGPSRFSQLTFASVEHGMTETTVPKIDQSFLDETLDGSFTAVAGGGNNGDGGGRHHFN